MPQKVYKTWYDILQYNAPMLATDYPVLQQDELQDLLYALSALRVYCAAGATSSTAELPPLPRSAMQTYLDAEHAVIRTTLEANLSLRCGFSVEDYMTQLKPLDAALPTTMATTSNYVTLRELLHYTQHDGCVRPRRLIMLHGLPLLAAPRLQFGGEWFGDIAACQHVRPNFVDRLRNCRYLIEIGGVRRFITYEDPQNDGKCACDLKNRGTCTCADLYTQCALTNAQSLKIDMSVDGFVKQEELAWRVACAVWDFQEDALSHCPFVHHNATQAQLVQWLADRCALFRIGPLRKNYLSTGEADVHVAWNRRANKGHLFAKNFDQATDVLRFEPPVATQFCNIAIVDFTAPNRSQVHQILSHAGYVTNLRGRVFMHCAGGWGRTGMGLLLSVMTLYDVEWDTGMKLMYRLYKRQSIEEVEHLLHASIQHFPTIEKVLQRMQKGGPRGHPPLLNGVVTSPTATSDDVRRILHQRFNDANNNTITYHGIIIPQFQKWIVEFKQLNGVATSEAARKSSLQFGRPVSHTLRYLPSLSSDILDGTRQTRQPNTLYQATDAYIDRLRKDAENPTHHVMNLISLYNQVTHANRTRTLPKRTRGRLSKKKKSRVHRSHRKRK
jgi:hypothetical protein